MASELRSVSVRGHHSKTPTVWLAFYYGQVKSTLIGERSEPDESSTTRSKTEKLAFLDATQAYAYILSARTK